jgi:hypothetical protein
LDDFLRRACKRINAKGNSYLSDLPSIKQQVFALLDKNPLLTPKPLCKLLGLEYKTHGKYTKNLRSQWKGNHKNERGSKCLLHGWRGWCYLPTSFIGSDKFCDGAGGIRTRAVEVGWLASRARNRWLLWKDRLGRLQWFETGRVNLYVRKPANLGKAYQLICNAFSFTGLITDMKVLEEVLGGLRFKGAHYVFPVGQRLPKLTIDLFQKSNGIVIKVGDDSHPDSLEVLATYPDWAERNERILEQVNEVLKRLFEPSGNLQSKRGDVNYVT